MLAAPAQANTYTVTINADSGAGSLRDAISHVNADSSADVIQFASNVTGQISLTSGQLTITNSVTIEGPGANVLAVDAGGLSRVLQVGTVGVTVNVTIQGLTLRNGNTSEGNGASGILAYSGSPLTLEDCAITGNTYSGTAGQVGGVSADSLVAQRCLFANNVGVFGGAVHAAGATTLENCTFVGNQSGSRGGALIYTAASSLSSLTMESCTVTGNTAGYQGGGILIETDFNVIPTVHNCVIAGNSAQYLPDIYAFNLQYPGPAMASLGYNLIGNTSGSSGWVASDLQNVNPLLGPLADHGGPTQTCALLPGSPALFAADPANFPTTDQRGIARPQGTQADIGAFELRRPVANAGLNRTVILASATSYVTVTLDGTASYDPDGEGLNYYSWSGPYLVNPNSPVTTATPPPGIYTYTLTVTNGAGLSNSSTVTITIVAPPVANSQSVSVNANTSANVTLAGSDPIGAALTYQIVTGPANGTLSGTAPNLTYTPNSGYVGADSFTFTVTDSYGAVSAPATVSITVVDTTPPVITLNGTSPMSVVQGSVFTDPGVTVVDAVYGSASVQVSGSVNTAVPGTYTLTYTATDQAGLTASATRTVIVTPASKVQVKLTGIGELLGIVGVVVTLDNASSATLSNIKITSASLIGVNAALVLPDGFNLKAGHSQDVGLLFFPLKKGQTGVLSISGTYSGGTFSFSQTVTIP
jgi:hypothetical protein